MSKGHSVARGDMPANQVVGPTTEISASTLIYTLFTKAGETRLVYSATTWVVCRLMLENSGPVAIGTRQQIGPALSGKGILLPTKEWVRFALAKGDRLFMVAEGINRVKFICEQVPWQEQILGSVRAPRASVTTHAGIKR